MRVPSGENRGNDSSPGGELKRTATPPALGTTQMSPAYTNAMCVAETEGSRNIRASICAPAGRAPAATHRHMQATRRAKRLTIALQEDDGGTPARHAIAAPRTGQIGAGA